MVNKLKTCRCCLLEVSKKNDLYEFSSEVSVDNDLTSDPQMFVKISDCYMQITAVTISEEQEDSSKICSSCLGDLKFCYQFQKKCLEAEKAFDGFKQEKDSQEPLIIDENEEHQSDPSMIEYVEEEYIDEMNDEDMHDEYETEEPNFVAEAAPSPKRRRTETVKLEDGSFFCEICPATFNSKEDLHHHFNCMHEKQDSNESDDLKDKQELFQCDFCGKISLTQDEADSHILEHEGESRYKCKKCDEKFSTKEEAREHLSCHNDAEKSFKCDSCPKSFKNRYQLNLHNRVHTGEKPFACSICNRCFSMSSNLQKHIDTHSTEKPYPCTICNQLFKTQRSLKFHTVCYHKPEDKVKCQLCDKGFVSKSYLKMHMLYHTGQKNFTCTICNSKYYKSSHLKRHIQNVHFKLRLMKCDFCSSDFVRKETYRAHVTSHHKRHLTDQEFADTLEKIRKFQPPSLDVHQFTLEKQKNLPVATGESDEADKEMEYILEDGADEGEMTVELTDEQEETYYEETELYEDEQ